jgi:hypothetical protein
MEHHTNPNQTSEDIPMFRNSLHLVALGALLAGTAATPAAVGCCGCPTPCAPPAEVQIWGLSPGYVVNQGPVYTGPGFTTEPTYEGESSTVGYPYAAYESYPGYRPFPDFYQPIDRGPYFQRRFYRGYWPDAGLPQPYPADAHYYRGYSRHDIGPRVVRVSAAHWVAHTRRDIDRDPRDR